jgi:Ca2+-binding RTX toxin-like protein
MTSTLPLQTIQNQLAHFATQSNFDIVMSTAFGTRLNQGKLQTLRQQWLNGNFSIIPDVQILSQGELGTANGAYAVSLDKIFISSNFLANASESQVSAVLLEEVGHRIDQLLNNGMDSAGDEGEIFSRLVNGESLSSTVLTGLKSQDDSGVINIGGHLIAVENAAGFVVFGTSGADRITPTITTVLVPVTANDDRVFAGGGNDTVDGGDGNDYIDLGDGDDYVNISSLGDDTFVGGGGDDYIYGYIGNEQYDGGNGDDTLLGHSGNDTIYGGDGSDSINGGDGNDNLYGGIGDDTLYGEIGNDILWSGDGNDTLYGGSGNDFLIGANGQYLFYGGDGNDYLGGGNNYDILSGDAGNDSLYGYAGNDYLYGGAGNDNLSGGAGNNFLYGGTGNDVYIIDGDVDFGKHAIFEPSPFVIVLGSEAAGIDTLDFRSTSRSVIVDLTSANEQQIASGVYIAAAPTSGSITSRLRSLDAIEKILGGQSRDTFFGNALSNYIDGGNGSDNLYGGAGNDTLYGGAGNDFIYGEENNDLITGGFGNDSLSGGAGDDKLFGYEDADTMSGGTGNDFLNGGIGKDLLRGGLNNDILTGDYDNDSLYGDDGNDSLYGNYGDDSLYGGYGDDKFDGGNGNDILYGGNGNDHFGFLTVNVSPLIGNKNVANSLGRDTITDFTVGVDKIVLAKTVFTKINSLIGSNFSVVANDTLAGRQAAAIVYSTGSGNLFYNFDGAINGAANNGLGANGGNLAFLSTKPVLTASDFTITG